MQAVGTLDGVAGSRGVRGDTDNVRRSSRVERRRIIVRWCTDRLTAPLTAPLTAMLTDELVGRFLQFDHYAAEGSARSGSSQRHSQQHPQTQFTAL